VVKDYEGGVVTTMDDLAEALIRALHACAHSRHPDAATDAREAVQLYENAVRADERNRITAWLCEVGAHPGMDARSARDVLEAMASELYRCPIGD
jgi:hypothetical protein